jgi:hypothetical protein
VAVAASGRRFPTTSDYLTDQSPEIFGKENLGPGKRRWTRSRRRRGFGPGRWSRRCCCCGGGSWRGSRRLSDSGRRRRCTSFHRSKGVDPTPIINVVWRARGSALSRTNVDSRVIQGIVTEAETRSLRSAKGSDSRGSLASRAYISFTCAYWRGGGVGRFLGAGVALGVGVGVATHGPGRVTWTSSTNMLVMSPIPS